MNFLSQIRHEVGFFLCTPKHFSKPTPDIFRPTYMECTPTYIEGRGNLKRAYDNDLPGLRRNLINCCTKTILLMKAYDQREVNVR